MAIPTERGIAWCRATSRLAALAAPANEAGLRWHGREPTTIETSISGRSHERESRTNGGSSKRIHIAEFKSEILSLRFCPLHLLLDFYVAVFSVSDRKWRRTAEFGHLSLTDIDRHMHDHLRRDDGRLRFCSSGRVTCAERPSVSRYKLQSCSSLALPAANERGPLRIRSLVLPQRPRYFSAAFWCSRWAYAPGRPVALSRRTSIWPQEAPSRQRRTASRSLETTCRRAPSWD